MADLLKTNPSPYYVLPRRIQVFYVDRRRQIEGTLELGIWICMDLDLDNSRQEPEAISSTRNDGERWGSAPLGWEAWLTQETRPPPHALPFRT